MVSRNRKFNEDEMPLKDIDVRREQWQRVQ
jgi:hypothetical protein